MDEPIDNRRDAVLQAEVVASLGDLDVREKIGSKNFRGCTSNAIVWDPSRDRVLLGGVRKLPNERKAGAMLWDFVAGRARDFPDAGEGPVAFLDDGTPIQLEFDRDQASLALVDLAQRRVVRHFEVPGELHFASPTDLPWIAPDASLVGAPVRMANGKDLLVVWDGGTGLEMRQFEVRARCAAFSADGTLIAAAGHFGGDDAVAVWSLASGCKLGPLKKNSRSRVRCLAFGRDGRRRQPGDGEGCGWRLAAGDSSAMAWIWDVDSQQLHAVCRGQGFEIIAIAFSPDGARLVTTERTTDNCRIFDAETGAMLLEMQVPGDEHGLTFAPDGHRLAVSAEFPSDKEGTVHILELLDDRGLRSLCGLEAPVEKTVLSPDNRLVAALSRDWTIAVWDHLTGQRLCVFDAPLGSWADNAEIAFSPDSRRLACAAGHEARLWDLKTGELFDSWSFADDKVDHDALVNRLAFHGPDQLLHYRVETRDGAHLPDNGAPAEQYPRVGRILELQTGGSKRLIKDISDFDWNVLDAQMTSDGRYLVAEGLSGRRRDELIRSVIIYELATGLHVPPLILDKNRQAGAKIRLDPLGRLLAINTDSKLSVTLVQIPGQGLPMKTATVNDLRRSICQGDRESLDRLLSDAQPPAGARIAEVVGRHAVHDFVVAHFDRFHGSTKAEFLGWLESMPHDELTAWLVERLKAGDQKTWNHWLATNRDMLRKWTETRVGVSPGHGGDESDVVQTSCAELYGRIPPSIATYGQFLNWVRATLRRRAIDLGRKKVFKTIVEQSSGVSAEKVQEMLGAIDPMTSTPSEQVIRDEREEHILACSDNLSVEELLVVRLKQCDGCSLKEVAAGLGRSAVQTAKLYYQALGSLREVLDAMDSGGSDNGQDRPTERVRRAVRQLQGNQRIAVELEHFEDYSLWEIAQVLGYADEAAPLEGAARKKTESAVASLLYRSMKALRTDLLSGLTSEGQ